MAHPRKAIRTSLVDGILNHVTFADPLRLPLPRQDHPLQAQTQLKLPAQGVFALC